MEHTTLPPSLMEAPRIDRAALAMVLLESERFLELDAKDTNDRTVLHLAPFTGHAAVTKFWRRRLK